jgi:hypothetical protein
VSSWPWDRLAQSNAPSHAVLVEALQPRPGEGRSGGRGGEAPEAAWEFFQESFGPLRELVSRLSDDAVAELRAEFVGLRERFADVPPSYLLVLGRRR